MRLRIDLKWIVAAGIVLAAGTAQHARAQSGGAPTGGSQPGGSQPGVSQLGGQGGAAGSTEASGQMGATGSTGTGQMPFTGQPQLSPQEQLAQADVMVTRMQQASSNARVMLELARKDRDVIKILCLNEKLSELDAAVRTGKERRAVLQGAVDRQDATLASHEFTVMSIVKQRSDQASAEASQCVGKNDATVAGAQGTVQTTIDPNILANPTGDDTRFPDTDMPQPGLSDPPQAVSPAA